MWLIFINFFLFANINIALLGQYQVPSQYPTIQEVIDIAIDDDVVLVSPGTYSEHIDFF